MKRRQFIHSSIGIIGLGFISPSLIFRDTFAWAQEAAPTDGLLFYLPLDDSLDAKVGAFPEPASVRGKSTFVEGKFGKAWRSGEKNQLLLYRADGNMHSNEGTVSIWVNPDWKPDDAHFHLFWQMRGNGHYILYRDNGGRKLNFLYRGKGLSDTQYTDLGVSIDDWKPGTWHNVSATWQAGAVRLYVDGVLQREVVESNIILPEVNAGAVMMVGDMYHEGYGIQSGMSGIPDTSLEDLRIYNRALDVSEIRALAGLQNNAAIVAPAPPRVIIPKAINPPIIGGEFTFDKWRDAVGFTGFFDLATKTLTERQTATLLTYDDKNLYIATFAPIPANMPLRSGVDRRDGPVYGDDSIEIYLDPENKRDENNLFQFIGNSTGHIMDLKNGDPSWNGNWNYNSQLQGNWRGFGQTYWVTELAISFQSLGRSTPKPGEKWGANFARTWQVPEQMYTSWSWLDKVNYRLPAQFGTLEFQEKTPSFQWFILRNITSGQPTLEGTTRTADPVHLTLRTSVKKLVDTDLPVEKGKAKLWLQEIDLAASLQDALQVQARVGDQLLYEAQMPYRLEAETIRVLLSPVPSLKVLLVDADPFRFRKEFQDGGTMQVTFSDDNGKVLLRQSIAATAALPARAELPLKDVPVGAYRVDITVADRAKKELAARQLPFTKPPTPVWVGNTIGVTDRVLKPWTPIKSDGDKVEMWGREYQFGAHAFPQQVKSLNKNLLQAPARLMIDGKALQAGTTKIAEKSDAKVVRTGTSKSGSWNVNWKSTAEYDGMLWYEVTLTPQGTSATLQSLALELPLNNETASLYHASNGPYGLGGGESGATPAQWKSSRKQVFWLGNEDVGLSWFAESDQHWKLSAADDAISFTRNAKSTFVRVQFVNSAMNVRQPITYQFGLQATPMRPMPKEWRAMQESAQGSFVPNDPVQPTNSISWWMNWSPYISSPLDAFPEAPQLVDKYHAAGSKVIPYQALLALNEKAPDFDYYKTEWLTQPRMDGGGERGQQTWWVNVKGSFQDYFLYALRERVRKDGWDGMYFDFAQGGVPDTNIFHGSGYIDDDGVRRPTYDFLAQREFFKRLWAMLQEETGNDEPIVMIHNSQCVLPPVDSFANIYFDGEQFAYSPKVEDDYTKILPRATFRAEFLGTNFGGIPMFLPEIGHYLAKYQSSKSETERATLIEHIHRGTDSVLLYTLTHGTLFSPEYMDQEYWKPVRDGRKSFDIGKAEFLGYWENDDVVKLSPQNPDVVASLYFHKDKLWLVVGNYGEQDQPVTTTLSVAHISPQINMANAAFTNIWKEGAVAHDGNNWSFTVTAKTARIIEIK